MFIRKITCLLIALCVTSCSNFVIRKPIIEQGNIITPEKISELHVGMTEKEVRNIMGNAVLVNIFSPNRIDYIYTYQRGDHPRLEKHVACIFINGQLSEILVR